MNRSGQIVSALIAIIGTSKLLFPAAIGQLFALDKPVAFIALAVAVVAYGVWHGPLRFLSGSAITGLLGLSVLAFGAVSISSPTLLGIRGTYLPVADIFLMLEAGIVLEMIGLEKKRSQTFSPLLMLSVASQLLFNRQTRAAGPAHSSKARSA